MQFILLLKEIIRLKFLLALSAVFACWQTLLFSVTPFSIPYYLWMFVFFATLAAYNVRHIHIGHASVHQRGGVFKLLNRNSTKEIIWISTSLVCVVVFLFLTHTSQKIIALSSVGALLYSMPFTRNAIRLKGIRNIYILKNIWLALIWSIVTVLLPLSESGTEVFKVEYGFLFMSRFFFIYSIALVFDIRDALHDPKRNVFTIATQNGILLTKLLAAFSIIIFCMLSLYLIFLHPALPNLSPVFYGSASLMLALIAAARPGHHFWFYEVLMDGVLSIQAFLVLIVLAIYN